jgi:RNA polymerase sigma factor (sigma-70 family)
MVTKVRPATPRDLFKLACQNIQWALDDIRKRVLTKRRKAPGHRVDAEELAEQAEHYDGPEDLAIWTEFHQSLSELPEEARELWNLHYYLGLSPAAVAQLLGVPRTTLRRRWIEAMASLPLEDIPPIGDE